MQIQQKHCFLLSVNQEEDLWQNLTMLAPDLGLADFRTVRNTSLLLISPPVSGIFCYSSPNRQDRIQQYVVHKIPLYWKWQGPITSMNTNAKILIKIAEIKKILLQQNIKKKWRKPYDQQQILEEYLIKPYNQLDF